LPRSCANACHEVVSISGYQAGDRARAGQNLPRAIGKDGRSQELSGRFRSEFLTNLSQPMPLHEKLSKLTRNLWRRVVLRQACCGHDGEPGC
jgi:hypothetical protein